MTALIDKTLHRLMAIKREALEGLRRDVGQLERLFQEAETVLSDAERQWDSTCADIARIQTSDRPMNAMELLGWRRHLTSISETVETCRSARDAAAQQRDRARDVLASAYREVRALERVGERREVRSRIEALRKDYAVRDDQEMARRLGAATGLEARG